MTLPFSLPAIHDRTPQRTIYDVIYGFIPITEWEEKIINSPLFQRLRWIKQLGFSHYIFPGAEHNRFAHVIGVMHSMHQMLNALGLAVSDSELFDPKVQTPQALLHKNLRMAALLHDIGTFPFSHAIEYAYIRDGRRTHSEKEKNLPNSHEHLGSFIIKNTRFEGGLTRILEDYGFDVQMISWMIKGVSPYGVANQLMHSDLDADRMDYLIRDAHYTGIHYGQFDREYILANLALFDSGHGQLGFAIQESSSHAVEDFLFSRFSWYSQIIKNSGSAKFDILSSHVAEALLQKKLIVSFSDLLEMISSGDERFFWWNDLYFMHRCQELHIQKTKETTSLKVPLEEWLGMLLYRKAPKTLHHPLFEPQLFRHPEEKQERIQKIQDLLQQFQVFLSSQNKQQGWLLVDLPEKDVVFTTSQGPGGRPLTIQDRDPIKILSRSGTPSLLIHRENSLMKSFAGLAHFIPSIYADETTAQNFDRMITSLG